MNTIIRTNLSIGKEFCTVQKFLIWEALFLQIVTLTSASLDEVLLKDMMPQGSPLCTDFQTTSTSFQFTPSPSSWSSVNVNKEQYTFLAEMKHTDASPNRTWTFRFGTGGNIYSIRSQFGEAIPPQTLSYAPWMDEVTQQVAVDLTKNANATFFVHQAGTYQRDNLATPFYSPNIARHCEGNTCYFASWGQQAWIPMVFKSDMIYLTQYSDCGNGVIEYAQMYLNVNNGTVSGDPFLVEYGPPVFHYLNIPWAGVRTYGNCIYALRKTTCSIDAHFIIASCSL